MHMLCNSELPNPPYEGKPYATIPLFPLCCWIKLLTGIYASLTIDTILTQLQSQDTPQACEAGGPTRGITPEHDFQEP